MAGPETPRDDAVAAEASSEPAVVRGADVVASGADRGDALEAEHGEAVRDDVVTATLRRSPKYTMFLLLGAALGVVIALILTVAFSGTQQPSAEGYAYSQGQVFGFLILICVPVGLVVSGTVALILDRAAARRARELTVERERFRTRD